MEQKLDKKPDQKEAKAATATATAAAAKPKDAPAKPATAVPAPAATAATAVTGGTGPAKAGPAPLKPKELAARVVGAGSAGDGKACEKPDRTKLIAPLLLRLAAQRDDIKKTFDLLHRLFKALDDNGDGFIDKMEIAGLIKDQLLDQDSVKKLALYDTNRDGKISFTEFLAFLADELSTSQGEM